MASAKRGGPGTEFAIQLLVEGLPELEKLYTTVSSLRTLGDKPIKVAVGIEAPSVTKIKNAVKSAVETGVAEAQFAPPGSGKAAKGKGVAGATRARETVNLAPEALGAFKGLLALEDPIRRMAAATQLFTKGGALAKNQNTVTKAGSASLRVHSPSLDAAVREVKSVLTSIHSALGRQPLNLAPTGRGRGGAVGEPAGTVLPPPATRSRKASSPTVVQPAASASKAVAATQAKVKKLTKAEAQAAASQRNEEEALLQHLESTLAMLSQRPNAKAPAVKRLEWVRSSLDRLKAYDASAELEADLKKVPERARAKPYQAQFKAETKKKFNELLKRQGPGAKVLTAENGLELDAFSKDLGAKAEAAEAAKVVEKHFADLMKDRKDAMAHVATLRKRLGVAAVGTAGGARADALAPEVDLAGRRGRGRGAPSGVASHSLESAGDLFKQAILEAAAVLRATVENIPKTLQVHILNGAPVSPIAAVAAYTSTVEADATREQRVVRKAEREATIEKRNGGLRMATAPTARKARRTALDDNLVAPELGDEVVGADGRLESDVADDGAARERVKLARSAGPREKSQRYPTFWDTDTTTQAGVGIYDARRLFDKAQGRIAGPDGEMSTEELLTYRNLTQIERRLQEEAGLLTPRARAGETRAEQEAVGDEYMAGMGRYNTRLQEWQRRGKHLRAQPQIAQADAPIKAAIATSPDLWKLFQRKPLEALGAARKRLDREQSERESAEQMEDPMVFFERTLEERLVASRARDKAAIREMGLDPTQLGRRVVADELSSYGPVRAEFADPKAKLTRAQRAEKVAYDAARAKVAAFRQSEGEEREALIDASLLERGVPAANIPTRKTAEAYLSTDARAEERARQRRAHTAAVMNRVILTPEEAQYRSAATSGNVFIQQGSKVGTDVLRNTLLGQIGRLAKVFDVTLTAADVGGTMKDDDYNARVLAANARAGTEQDIRLAQAREAEKARAEAVGAGESKERVDKLSDAEILKERGGGKARREMQRLWGAVSLLDNRVLKPGNADPNSLDARSVLEAGDARTSQLSAVELPRAIVSQSLRALGKAISATGAVKQMTIGALSAEDADAATARIRDRIKKGEYAGVIDTKALSHELDRLERIRKDKSPLTPEAARLRAATTALAEVNKEFSTMGSDLSPGGLTALTKRRTAANQEVEAAEAALVAAGGKRKGGKPGFDAIGADRDLRGTREALALALETTKAFGKRGPGGLPTLGFGEYQKGFGDDKQRKRVEQFLTNGGAYRAYTPEARAELDMRLEENARQGTSGRWDPFAKRFVPLTAREAEANKAQRASLERTRNAGGEYWVPGNLQDGVFPGYRNIQPGSLWNGPADIRTSADPDDIIRTQRVRDRAAEHFLRDRSVNRLGLDVIEKNAEKAKERAAAAAARVAEADARIARLTDPNFDQDTAAAAQKRAAEIAELKAREEAALKIRTNWNKKPGPWSADPATRAANRGQPQRPFSDESPSMVKRRTELAAIAARRAELEQEDSRNAELVEQARRDKAVAQDDFVRLTAAEKRAAKLVPTARAAVSVTPTRAADKLKEWGSESLQAEMAKQDDVLLNLGIEKRRALAEFRTLGTALDTYASTKPQSLSRKQQGNAAEEDAHAAKMAQWLNQTGFAEARARSTTIKDDLNAIAVKEAAAKKRRDEAEGFTFETVDDGSRSAFRTARALARARGERLPNRGQGAADSTVAPITGVTGGGAPPVGPPSGPPGAPPAGPPPPTPPNNDDLTRRMKELAAMIEQLNKADLSMLTKQFQMLLVPIIEVQKALAPTYKMLRVVGGEVIRSAIMKQREDDREARRLRRAEREGPVDQRTFEQKNEDRRARDRERADLSVTTHARKAATTTEEGLRRKSLPPLKALGPGSPVLSAIYGTAGMEQELPTIDPRETRKMAKAFERSLKGLESAQYGLFKSQEAVRIAEERGDPEAKLAGLRKKRSNATDRLAVMEADLVANAQRAGAAAGMKDAPAYFEDMKNTVVAFEGAQKKLAEARKRQSRLADAGAAFEAARDVFVGAKALPSDSKLQADQKRQLRHSAVDQMVNARGVLKDGSEWKQANADVKEHSGSVNRLRADLTALAETDKDTAGGQSFLGNLASKMKSLFYYMTAGAVLYQGIAMIRGAFLEVKALEADLARVQGVVAGRRLSDRLMIEEGVIESAKRYGVAIRDVLGITKTFVQSGFTAKEALQQTNAALVGVQGADLNPQQAIEMLVSVRNLSDGNVLPMDILDRIARVEAGAAITSQDLSVAIQRVGSIATQLQPNQIGNIDAFDTVMAATTEIVEKTRVSGNQAATSLRFMLSRLAAPDVAKALQGRFGIKLAGRDENDMRPMIDILASIADKYKSMKESGDTVGANSLLATFAGARQINAASALFGDFDRVMKIATNSAAAFGDAQARLTLQMDTLDFKTKAFGASFGDFANSFVKNSGLLDFSKFLMDFGAKGLSNVAGLMGSPTGGVATGVGMAATAATLPLIANGLLNLATKPGVNATLARVAGVFAAMASSGFMVAAATLVAVIGAIAAFKGLKYLTTAEPSVYGTPDPIAEVDLQQIQNSEQYKQFRMQARDLNVTPGELEQRVAEAFTTAQKSTAATLGLRDSQVFTTDDKNRKYDPRLAYTLEEQFRAELLKLVPALASAGDEAEQTALALRLLKQTSVRQQAVGSTYAAALQKSLGDGMSVFEDRLYALTGDREALRATRTFVSAGAAAGMAATRGGAAFGNPGYWKDDTLESPANMAFTGRQRLQPMDAAALRAGVTSVLTGALGSSAAGVLALRTTDSGSDTVLSEVQRMLSAATPQFDKLGRPIDTLGRALDELANTVLSLSALEQKQVADAEKAQRDAGETSITPAKLRAQLQSQGDGATALKLDRINAFEDAVGESLFAAFGVAGAIAKAKGQQGQLGASESSGGAGGADFIRLVIAAAEKKGNEAVARLEAAGDSAAAGRTRAGLAGLLSYKNRPEELAKIFSQTRITGMRAVRDRLLDTVVRYGEARSETANFQKLQAGVQVRAGGVVYRGGADQSADENVASSMQFMRGLAGVRAATIGDMMRAASRSSMFQSYFAENGGINMEGQAELYSGDEGLTPERETAGTREAKRQALRALYRVQNDEEKRKFDEQYKVLQDLYTRMESEDAEVLSSLTDEQRATLKKAFKGTGSNLENFVGMAMSMKTIEKLSQLDMSKALQTQFDLSQRIANLDFSNVLADIQLLERQDMGRIARSSGIRRAEARGDVVGAARMRADDLRQVRDDALATAKQAREARDAAIRIDPKFNGAASAAPLAESERTFAKDTARAESKFRTDSLSQRAERRDNAEAAVIQNTSAIISQATSGLQAGLRDWKAFGSGQFFENAFGAVASTIQDRLSSAFVDNLLGPNGLFGEQMKTLFGSQLLQERDIIVQAHIAGITAGFAEAGMAAGQSSSAGAYASARGMLAGGDNAAWMPTLAREMADPALPQRFASGNAFTMGAVLRPSLGEEELAKAVSARAAVEPVPTLTPELARILAKVPAAQQDSTLPPNFASAALFDAAERAALRRELGVEDPGKLYRSPRDASRFLYRPNLKAENESQHNVFGASGRRRGESWEQYEFRVFQGDAPATAAETTSSLDRLRSPEHVAAFKRLIEQGQNSGIRMTVAETARDASRQEALWRKGRTDDAAPVTWTLTSDHIPGDAADIYPMNDQGERVLGRSPTTLTQMGGRWMSEEAAWRRQRDFVETQPGFNVMSWESGDLGHVTYSEPQASTGEHFAQSYAGGGRAPRASAVTLPVTGNREFLAALGVGAPRLTSAAGAQYRPELIAGALENRSFSTAVVAAPQAVAPATPNKEFLAALGVGAPRLTSLAGSRYRPELIAGPLADMLPRPMMSAGTVAAAPPAVAPGTTNPEFLAALGVGAPRLTALAGSRYRPELIAGPLADMLPRPTRSAGAAAVPLQAAVAAPATGVATAVTMASTVAATAAALARVEASATGAATLAAPAPATDVFAKLEALRQAVAEQAHMDALKKEQARARKYQFAAVAGNLAGGFVGSRINSKGNFGQTGASIGTMAGSKAISQMFGVKAAAALGPWGALIGGLAGGVLGSLFKRRSPKQTPEYSALERIEQNTREQITAIENQTRDLMSIDSRMLNVPASFVAPGYRPQGDGGRGGAGGGQFGSGGGSEPPQINIVINDATDPQRVAKAVATVLRAEMAGLGTYTDRRG